MSIFDREQRIVPTFLRTRMWIGLFGFGIEAEIETSPAWSAVCRLLSIVSGLFFVFTIDGAAPPSGDERPGQ